MFKVDDFVELKGATKPLLRDGKIYKLECHSHIKRIRNEYVTGLAFNKAGVNTPQGKIEQISIEFPDRVFTGSAFVRKYIDDGVQIFSSFKDLIEKYPSFLSHDKIYKIFILDFLFAQWDRRACNVLVQHKPSVSYLDIIPIDFDRSMDFENVPMSLEGFEKVLSHYILDLKKPFIKINPFSRAYRQLVMGELKLAYLATLNPLLVERFLGLKPVLDEFLQKWCYANIPEDFVV